MKPHSSLTWHVMLESLICICQAAEVCIIYADKQCSLYRTDHWNNLGFRNQSLTMYILVQLSPPSQRREDGSLTQRAHMPQTQSAYVSDIVCTRSYGVYQALGPLLCCRKISKVFPFLYCHFRATSVIWGKELSTEPYKEDNADEKESGITSQPQDPCLSHCSVAVMTKVTYRRKH